MVFTHIAALKANRQQDYSLAWKNQKRIVEILTDLLPSVESNWLVPSILMCIRESRLLTLKIGKESKEMAECTMVLRNVATVFNNRKDVVYGKMNGFIGSINELAKVLFAQNNLRLCEDIYESYNDRIEQELMQCSSGQLCTYHYYCGRVRLYEDNYKQARELLLRALQTCDPTAEHNLRRILFFLIPVNMMFGVLASDATLERYGMTMYKRLSHAIRFGDLREYDAIVVDYERTLIHRGLYLIVLSMKLLVQRTFMKRAVDIYGSSQIPFKALHKALDLQDRHMTDDELSCLLSMLKYKGYLKGYVSYSMKTLVVSKVLAFPPVKDVTK